MCNGSIHCINTYIHYIYIYIYSYIYIYIYIYVCIYIYVSTRFELLPKANEMMHDDTKIQIVRTINTHSPCATNNLYAGLDIQILLILMMKPASVYKLNEVCETKLSNNNIVRLNESRPLHTNLVHNRMIRCITVRNWCTPIMPSVDGYQMNVYIDTLTRILCGSHSSTSNSKVYTCMRKHISIHIQFGKHIRVKQIS